MSDQITRTYSVYPSANGTHALHKRVHFGVGESSKAIAHAKALVLTGYEKAYISFINTYSDEWEGDIHPGFFAVVDLDTMENEPDGYKMVNILGPVKFKE